MSLDNASMTIYGDSISGNCLKVKFVADRLRIPYRWIETSVVKKETRTPEFLALKRQILARIRETSGMATDHDLLDQLSRTATA